MCTAIVLVIAFVCYKLKLIKLTALPVLAVLLDLVAVFGTFKLVLSTVCVFALLIITDFLFKKDIHTIVSDINKKEGPRDPIQIIVNCLPATVFVVLFSLTEYRWFLIAFFASIAEAVSDSMASDVGVLSKKAPVNIITFKPIQKGMSGGVSALGSTAAVITSLFSAMICVIFYNSSILESAIIVLSASSGVFLDSILGATLQIRYFCPKCGKETEKKLHCMVETIPVKGLRYLDNCAVNFLCNIWACCCPLIIGLIL